MICDLETLHTSFSSAEDQTTRNYTIEEAEVMSGGMACRTMRPKDKYAFMRCQIGKLLQVKTKSNEPEQFIFHLKAFGATWNQALNMLELQKE